jgi:hypothetical protein
MGRNTGARVFFLTFKLFFLMITYLSSYEDLIHPILICEVTNMEIFILRVVRASLYSNYI